MGDSTASDRVLSGTGLAVTIYGGSQPDMYLAAGEGASNTHQDDGSTAASATVLGCDRVDMSTTTIGLTCADSGGSLVLILGDSQGKVEGSSIMESLPLDVVQEILSRVPAESVFECKLVCKRWVTVVRGTKFAAMHLSCQLNRLHDSEDSNNNLAVKVEPCLFFACCIEDPEEYITLLFNGRQVSDRISIGEKYIYSQNLERIYHPRMHTDPLFDHLVGSCNGLVCAFQHHHLVLDPIYICNPLTREYVYLPQLVLSKEGVDPNRIVEGEVDLFYDMACGFGYVRSTNEYKVVRIHYLERQVGNVEVYTLGSGCGWRAIGKVPYRLDSTRNGRGTYANDAIYWISGTQVVAFDLANEEFRLLSSVPPCLQNRKFTDSCGLVALGRRLCFYMDTLRMEIWSLMISGDSKEAWRMEFDLDYEAQVGCVGCRTKKFQPISLTKNGEIIFLYSKSVLYYYDPKIPLLKIISNKASTNGFNTVEAIAHVNTFASLEAMGEYSKKYTPRQRSAPTPENSRRRTRRQRRARTPLEDVIDELDRVALVEGIDTTRFRLK